MDINATARLEALDRLCESLTKQQIEDLQIVIKNTEREVTWDRFDDDSVCMQDADATLASLARDLNFSPDDDDDDAVWS